MRETGRGLYNYYLSSLSLRFRVAFEKKFAFSLSILLKNKDLKVSRQEESRCSVAHENMHLSSGKL